MFGAILVSMINPRLARYTRPVLLAACIGTLSLVGTAVLTTVLVECTVAEDVVRTQHQGSWPSGQLAYLRRVFELDDWDSSRPFALFEGYTLKRTHVCIDNYPYELMTIPHPQTCPNGASPCYTAIAQHATCVVDLEAAATTSGEPFQTVFAGASWATSYAGWCFAEGMAAVLQDAQQTVGNSAAARVDCSAAAGEGYTVDSGDSSVMQLEDSTF